MTNNTKEPDMSAFVGIDFDCEFTLDEEFSVARAHIGLLSDVVSDRCYQAKNHFMDYTYCRPRLNKSQVLEWYDGLPEGFVWRIRWRYRYEDGDFGPMHEADWTTNRLNKALESDDFAIEWIKCIGVPEETEWSIAHDVPVVEV